MCREVNKRKGEEYQLIWKDQPDFVRMAAKLNALVIPFAAVGGAPLACIDVVWGPGLGQSLVAALRMWPRFCMHPAATRVFSNKRLCAVCIAFYAGMLCPLSAYMGHAVTTAGSLP